MFATFALAGEKRGTAILVADRPEGPYEPWSEGPVTPEDWLSLDGTLYVDEAGDPWMVFCHEWVQIQNGTVDVCVRTLRFPLFFLFLFNNVVKIRKLINDVQIYILKCFLIFIWLNNEFLLI